MIASFHDSSSNEWHKDFDTDWDIPVMEIVVTIVVVVGIAIVLSVCFKCCCRSKNGRVLAPPPADGVPPQPPGPHYPQQQYNTVTVQTAAMSHNTSYPGAAPYPTAGAPYPTTGAPYPNAGAPYPNAGAPYPTPGVGFPATGAPYPAVAPYPPSGIYHGGPSAPDAHAFLGIARPGWHPQALPPSYDQVMTAETTKQAPYNPNYLQ